MAPIQIKYTREVHTGLAVYTRDAGVESSMQDAQGFRVMDAAYHILFAIQLAGRSGWMRICGQKRRERERVNRKYN